MAIRNIYHELTSFNALMIAKKEVSVGKGEKNDVLRFEANLEDNIHEISGLLREMKIPQVHYSSFYVYEPKTRKVIYIDFTNKIIQRALYDAINPRLNRTFISDTYACIPGKGQLKALSRVARWMAETSWRPGEWYYYKFDVAKFFYRIDHGILMAMLAHKISDRQTLELLEYYICNTARPFGLPLCANQVDIDESEMLWDVGIPIGGGLSHTLGNLYLDPLDQYAKRTLQIPRYARYMDDIVMIDNDKERLKESGKRMEDFIAERLRLQFNQKTALRPARCDLEFVGCIISADNIRIRKSTTLRMKRRLADVELLYNAGMITMEQALQTVAAYHAMLSHVKMDKFEEKLWGDFVLTHGNLQAAKQHQIIYTE